ncbi:MAG: response regulator transcription factor [Bacillota bacterium]
MHRKIRVIIVDDEARLRRGVERLVLSSSDEWEVVGSYASGQECVEAVKQEELFFDLLITDVKMPGMDGLTLIKNLKEFTSFHSMVISGFDDFQFLQTAMREGASDYLIKPIDRNEFKVQIEKIKRKIVSHWNDFLYKEEMESKAEQLTYVKQIQLLSEMTWKQDIDLSLLEWTKGFPAGDYQLMYVSLDNLKSKTNSFQQADWETWAFAIDNICEEMREHYSDSFIDSWKWNSEDLSFWLLLHNSKMSRDYGEHFEKRSFEFSNELRLNIRKFTPFTCSIAVSNPVNDLALLPSMKEELLTYIQFRLLYGGNQIFSKNTIERWRVSKKENDSKEIENQIRKVIFSLESRNQEKTKSEVQNFLNRIQDLDSPDEIKQKIHSFSIQIIHFMLKNSLEKDEYGMIKEVFDLTSKTSTFSELKHAVYEWVKKVLHALERMNTTLNIDYIDLAKDWIVAHLDQNITIQKIASHVYMNPTYFCEYFKNQMGETVLDFVTRVRIEKARDLLVSTDLRIYDIAQKVGYNDTKYFSKLFKKQYGDTPSKYKEKLIFEQR